MISEVDIRDWDHIDVKRAREALENVDDCMRMGPVHAFGAYNFLKQFFDSVEQIQQKQVKQVAALLRKKEE